MRKFLIKFVLIFVGICFAASATELNDFGIHNTFFDEFDTYVQSEDINLHVHTKVEKKKITNPVAGIMFYLLIHIFLTTGLKSYSILLAYFIILLQSTLFTQNLPSEFRLAHLILI